MFRLLNYGVKILIFEFLIADESLRIGQLERIH